MTKLNRKDINMSYYVHYEAVGYNKRVLICEQTESRMICKCSDFTLSFDLTEFKEMVLLFITGEDLREIKGIDQDGKSVVVKPLRIVRTESYDQWEKDRNYCDVTLRRVR